MAKKRKQFKKTKEEIQARIVPLMGYCLATDKITVDGLKVGYMYRENPDNEHDSGWRFFSGDEDDDYANNPENIDIHDVNTIAHYDNEIIPLLDAPYNVAFGRGENGEFEEELFESEIDDE